MIQAVLTRLLGGLINLGFGGLVDQTFGYLKHRGEMKNADARIRAEVTIETVRQAVEQTRIMADYNKAKLQYPWFWMFAGLFIVPLGLWWAVVILDSIFHFSWDVAHLPNPEMRQWAGDMIKWLFYVGSMVGVWKAIK